MSNAATVREIVGPAAWLNDRPWLDTANCDIDAYVNGLSARPDYDLAHYLRFWRDNGYVVFENVISQALIDEYLADIDRLIRDYRNFEIPIEIRGIQMSSHDVTEFPRDLTGLKLNQMQCFSPAAARLSVSPRISDFLHHVFHGPASVCQSLTFWRGSEQPIHIDYPYVRQQTTLSYLAASWIPLEDIRPDSGPLAYYPGGHHVDHSGFFDWGGGSIIHDEHSDHTPYEFAQYLWRKMAEAGIEAKTFCPKRGDVLIWHGNLPHEGTKVNDPALTRKSYVTHYTAERTLPDWMRNFDEAGNPVGVFENGSYCYRYRWFNGQPSLAPWP